VVILQIQICHRVTLYIEGQAPVAGNADAPRSGPIPHKLVDAPSRRASDTGHILGGDQDCQDSSYPFDKIASKFAALVVFDQALNTKAR